MKMKHLQVYLSMLSILNLVFLGVGGTLANELLKQAPSVRTLIIAGLASNALLIILVGLYWFAFGKTSKSK